MLAYCNGLEKRGPGLPRYPNICQMTLAHHDYGCKVMHDNNDSHFECTAFDLYSPYTFKEMVDTSFWYRLAVGLARHPGEGL